MSAKQILYRAVSRDSDHLFDIAALTRGYSNGRSVPDHGCFH